MERAFFDTQMKRLRGLKFAPDTLETHWAALRDMPDVLLDAAVQKAAGDAFEFPSPRMIKMYADQIRPRLMPTAEPDHSIPIEPFNIEMPASMAGSPGKVVATVNRVTPYHCEVCSDLGWRTFTCGGKMNPYNSEVPCQRRGPHTQPHEWVETCRCYETNPKVKRRIEHTVQMAAQRTSQRSHG